MFVDAAWIQRGVTRYDNRLGENFRYGENWTLSGVCVTGDATSATQYQPRAVIRQGILEKVGQDSVKHCLRKAAWRRKKRSDQPQLVTVTSFDDDGDCAPAVWDVRFQNVGIKKCMVGMCWSPWILVCRIYVLWIQKSVWTNIQKEYMYTYGTILAEQFIHVWPLSVGPHAVLESIFPAACVAVLEYNKKCATSTHCRVRVQQEASKLSRL